MAYTFSDKITTPGSSVIAINVDRNGQPFGRLWTFKKKPGYFHPWHAQAIGGEHRAFYPEDGGLKAAKDYLTAGGVPRACPIGWDKIEA